MTGIDGRSGFAASRAGRTWLAVVTAMLMAVSLMAAAAPAGAGGEDHPEKVTICHAAGREGTTHYETLTISENAVYGRHGNAGHFEENGTPLAGHEQDYFGECEPESNSASLTVVKRVRSTETDVPAARFPFAIDADGERELFVLASDDSRTFEIEFDSDRIDVVVGELTGELGEGFSFVSASCAMGDRVIPQQGSRASVTLPDGAHVTCTFVNRYVEPSGDTPSVTVIKDVRGDEGASTSEFEINVGSRDRYVKMTFNDGGSHTFLPVAGTVNFGIAELTINEEDGDWTTEISCLSDVRPPFGSSSSSLMIDEIGTGEDIVCTVINTYTAPDKPSGGGYSAPTTPLQINIPCFDGTAEDETGKCVAPEPPEVEVLGIQIEATATTLEAVTTDTLPFTGDDSSGLVVAGLLVLLTGSLLLGGSFLELALIRAGRHETSRSSIGRWDNN